MKTLLPILLFVALVGAALLVGFRSAEAPSPVSPSGPAPSGDAGQPRDLASTDTPASGLGPAPADPLAERALTLEQVAKRAQVQAWDERAQQKRRELYDANLASVDAAIAKAEAEGGHAEYVAALRKRRELLAEQAKAESGPPTAEAGGGSAPRQGG